MYLNFLPEEIKVLPYNNLIDINKLDYIYLLPNKCFDNARYISNIFNCEYVEGEVYIENIGIFFIHAWNKINDKYFDVTYSLFNTTANCRYFPIVEGYLNDLSNKYLLDNNIDLVTQYINSKPIQKIIENTKDSIFNYLIKK